MVSFRPPFRLFVFYFRRATITLHGNIIQTLLVAAGTTIVRMLNFILVQFQFIIIIIE